LPGLAAALVATVPAALAAQSQLDRADAVVADEARPPATRSPKPDARPGVSVVTQDATVGIADIVLVRAVRLDGLETLRENDFAAAIAPYVGKSLDAAGQSEILRAIVAVAREQGYPLATAMIPRQADANGELRVQIDEGRIGGIRFVGARHKLVDGIFSSIADGMPVTTARLTRAIRLAEAIPGVQLRKVTLVQEQELNILALDVMNDVIAGRVYVDNWGTSGIGPVLARGQAEARSVLGSGDEVELTLTGTPFEPDEYQNVGGRYSLPIDANGTRLAVSGSVARSYSPARGGRSAYRGTGSRLGIEASHPAIVGRYTLVRGSLGLSFRTSETLAAGTPVRNDRVALMTGAIDGYTLVGTGYFTGRLAIVQGTGWFGSTREGDALASRADGDARFTKIEARAGIDSKLFGPVSVAFDGEAQLASRPLLFGDEFGIGGASFGRGYDYREASGDNALAGSAEVRLDLEALKLPVQRLQLYGYGDAARVWDLRSAEASESIHSAGGGIRANVTRNFRFGLEVGIPLNGTRQPRGSLTTSLRF